jgi:methanogenic corrinoid protein MtbC1
MDIVGKKFKTNEIYLPEVLRSGKTMHAALDILEPLLAKSDKKKDVATVVIGTVEGDLHDIGKNMVVMLLRGAGFKVIDLGIDVKTQFFLDAVKSNGANILGMSALLTTTMPKMKETIDTIKEAGFRDQIKVIVGGAPVSPNFAKEIGADAHGSNAVIAVDVVKKLLG